MSKPKASFPSQPPSQQEVNAFCVAAARGDDAAVTEFLDQYGPAAVDRKNSRGRTALTEAIRSGRKDTVALLLERGADIDQKTSDGWTLLWLANNAGHSAIAALLKQWPEIQQQRLQELHRQQEIERAAQQLTASQSAKLKKLRPQKPHLK